MYYDMIEDAQDGCQCNMTQNCDYCTVLAMYAAHDDDDIPVMVSESDVDNTDDDTDMSDDDVEDE